ncbi:RidA family protein [cyanobiont of Ornithocercus magnificus]|nr:RidA family protein [cyanobiont of Ornithocercus magnificus]
MNASSACAITTKRAPVPVGAYSQAVLAGEWLYCSGQIPLDPVSGTIVGDGDISAETRQVLANLLAVLEAAGAGASQIVRTTVFLTNLTDLALVNEIYAEVFKGCVAPARACVQVAGLPKGAKVEIDCVAWLGANSITV